MCSGTMHMQGDIYMQSLLLMMRNIAIDDTDILIGICTCSKWGE